MKSIKENVTNKIEINKSIFITELIKVKEIELEPCINKRCLTCDKGSNRLKLCLSCNENLYGKVNYTNNFSKYVDCFEKKVLESLHF